ncbi:hypothetical protein AD12_1570 [Escherichia coli 1-392-07_S4_C2]|nr:hypothetical protein AD12_1570 [Escherichia coli 1-392-07_S4_C2]
MPLHYLMRICFIYMHSKGILEIIKINDILLISSPTVFHPENIYR